MSKPKFEKQIDGSVSTTILMPPELAMMVEKMGLRHVNLLGMPTDQVFPVGVKLLAHALNDMIKLGNARQLGDEWQRCLATTFSPRRDPLVDFDQRALHLDAKRVSGFVGVIRNGNQFMARGRHPSGTSEILIGNYRTGLEAAIARYRHYVENESLCYGQAEDEILAFRAIAPELNGRTDLEIWGEALEHARNVGRIDLILGPGTVSLFPGPREPQLFAQRAAWAQMDADAPKPTSAPTPELSTLFSNLFDAPKPTPIDLPDEPPKRGRPFKPCAHCGLKLKTIKEGNLRLHERASGERIPCQVNQGL